MTTRPLNRQGVSPGNVSSSVSSTRARARATVLLVEDDQQVRDLLVLLLRGSGYTVQPAASSAEAESLCHRLRPDVLVADVDLRGSASGPELYRSLRSRHPRLKALFVSGFAREEMLALGMDPGASPLLVKPFSAELLRSAVADVLAKPQPH